MKDFYCKDLGIVADMGDDVHQRRHTSFAGTLASSTPPHIDVVAGSIHVDVC
ncbi:hypothetical protein Hanom_Chr12g01159351 [Helianthus anomalus]